MAGAVHGIFGCVSLALGIKRSLWMFSQERFDELESVVFLGLSMISVGIVLVVFWDEIQGFMLSRTPAKERGLSIQAIKGLNRGRSVAAFANCCLGLAFLVQNVALERILVGTAFALSLWNYTLVKPYTLKVYPIYGAFQVLLAPWFMYYGSIRGLKESYPRIEMFVQKEATFVITCVTWGFFFYFLYSRKVVTKDTARLACLYFHVPYFVLNVVRWYVDAWWANVPPTLYFLAVLGLFQMYMIIPPLIIGKPLVKKQVVPRPNSDKGGTTKNLTE